MHESHPFIGAGWFLLMLWVAFIRLTVFAVGDVSGVTFGLLFLGHTISEEDR